MPRRRVDRMTPPHRVVHPVRKHSFEIDGESDFTKLPKLRRQFRTRRRLYASGRQSRTSTVRLVGDLELRACLVVSGRAHFLHSHSCGFRAPPRHRGIRKRQAVPPTPSDAAPDAFLVQKRPAEARSPYRKILPGADIPLHAVDVRLPNIDLDRRLFPQQFHVVAQDHQVEIVGSNVRSRGGPHDDHRRYVGVALRSFQKRSEPMEGRGRRPPVHQPLQGRPIQRASP